MTTFEFSTATEIVFGSGRARELGKRAAEFGTRVLVVTGSRPERSAALLSTLTEAGLVQTPFRVPGEPTTALIREGVQIARDAEVELVIGIGGGSALDAAKAIAALVGNEGDPLDYLEVVGRGRALARRGLPCLAVPTTSGTGSEVTRNAVLQAEAERVKVSLRGLTLLPRLALVDPELTLSVPPEVTAATGLDALTQVMEPFVSKARGPLTDSLCLEGLRRGARALPRAFRDPGDLKAREDLSLTSLFGGLSLANAKLGAVHGFAGPLGGALGAPHGALCARLLPEVMRENLAEARKRGNAEIVARYQTIARVLTDDETAAPEDGIEWSHALVESLAIPRLSAYGLRASEFEPLIARSKVASSMKGNPVELDDEQLTAILQRAL
ncbi:MAG TPA: iron-containing alcohol dehydrogenase [Polyangiaceae bacterium]|nr:iron-containing alcohol dehydrogenase [Polyangiaceae bacterium]